MVSRQLSLNRLTSHHPTASFTVFTPSSDFGRTGQDHCYVKPGRQAAISPDPSQFVTVGAILAVPPITDQGGLIPGGEGFFA